MTTSRVSSHTLIKAEEVEQALSTVHLTPTEFVALIVDATIHDDYKALAELVATLDTLRTQRAHQQLDAKLQRQPSPIEQEYMLDRHYLGQVLTKKRRRRASQTAQILVDRRQATTLRFHAFKALCDETSYLTANSRAHEWLRAINLSEPHLDAFDFLMAAMTEHFLRPTDREEARLIASRMFRNSEPADFGIDISTIENPFDEPTEVLFERRFDELYWSGAYTQLTFTGDYPSSSGIMQGHMH